jgi:phage terminase large subunit GpA-like protein
MTYANLDSVIAHAMQTWRPPERLSLSEWADRYFYLSPETSAEPGRWRTLPYQREILDSISDQAVTQVSLMKSARIGYTLMLSATIGYHIDHDPTSILVAQPTVDDAKGFSKEVVGPLLRDCPALADIVVRDSEDRKDSSTLTHKTFPGGVLSLVGANSGTGFRRVSRRVILLDEVDGYPPSAGNEGDPVTLAMQRGAYFWNRKIVCGSTPLVAGSSRIEDMFFDGDQRRFHVPCPTCSHMDFLAFSSKAERGHVMEWPDDDPGAAHFMCRGCGCAIEHGDKLEMFERGEWRPDKPGGTHRSYHLWAALSYSPGASWGAIATEFLAAKRGGAEKLRAFVNLWLGETWKERGEAPDWERLHERRETYAIGTVPAAAIVVTGGVDVQKDRLVYELVGWAPGKESWSVEAGALYGDTALEAGETDSPWAKLDELLARTFPAGDGRELPIAMLAVDSGYNTQVVYGWARRHPMSRVIACKGVAGSRALFAAPSPVDVTFRGKRMQRGYKVWPIGVDIAKGELYGWLRLRRGEGDPPAGYCHFPEYAEDYFQQLTAEHLVTTVNRRTHRAKLEWQVIPNRENHFLDCRILARVAAAVLGIDRLAPAARVKPTTTPDAAVRSPRHEAVEHVVEQPRKSSWIGQRRGSWLRRR